MIYNIMLPAQCLKFQMCRTLFRGQASLSCLSVKNPPLILRAVFPVRPLSTSNENIKEKIYIGELTVVMKSVKLFSLITSASGIIAQPFIIQQANAVGSTGLVVAAYGFIGFFTFVTPVLLHLVTRKYVTEILYDNETGSYTASIISIFLRKKSITFTPDDVSIPDVPGVFTTFTAKGVPLFVEPSVFKDFSHYGKIMGYDKPLDLKLGSLGGTDANTKK